MKCSICGKEGHKKNSKEFHLVDISFPTTKPILGDYPDISLMNTTIPEIKNEILEKHASDIKIIQHKSTTDSDPLNRKLAESYLKTLKSKSGNELLEEIFVRASGREPKDPNQKHGADSKDGLVEAKPCKDKYSAHISDDTAMCLKKAQSIPYCVIGVSSKDGSEIRWVIIVSYRIFDNERYKKILLNLNLPDTEWPSILPVDEKARQEILDKLIKEQKQKPKKYIRSNPLPFRCIENLPISEYSIWVNPNILKNPKPNAEEIRIIKLWKMKNAIS
jgi:hypothetical protein